MNRTFILFAALFVAVLGVVLMGGANLAVASDCCAPPRARPRPLVVVVTNVLR